MRLKNSILIIIITCLMTMGCAEEKGPFEKAGEKIDDKIEKTKDSAKEIKEEIKDEIDDHSN